MTWSIDFASTRENPAGIFDRTRIEPAIEKSIVAEPG
jgi:hypothetical protein